ncbi:hypothetical protein F4604DRAFT_1882281 [Suillus subluteus]|nr:hypothetical protein F4604DRAFT_1882281 [Suillus subluteus]
MTADERQALKNLRVSPAFLPGTNEDLDDFCFGDIWNGADTLPISHAGGEFDDLARGVLGDVWKGILPCSLILPMVGITTEALKIYRVVHLRCPHLSIQVFVKTICDLHRVDFHRHLSRQFSISFDLYLEIRWSTDAIVMESLGHDPLHWRLRHACPACSYVLTNEEDLTFTMLYAMDGNDFLKRFTRDLVCTSSDKDAPVDDSCEGRWENMDTAKTKKAWGIYDETGIFVAVCCHGFCLLIADMVQSGELAKYPLAVVAKLLDVFGGNLGGGYDIGCQFKTTLNNSTLGPLARSLNHTCLVSAFHGHAHRCLCQLVSLTTYIKGLGIEDLETCERTFSKSNSLASSLRYASVFHRQQAIDSYFEHNDNFEVYANLSNFLYSNYRQALDILANGNAVLPKLMQDIGVVDMNIFELWLEEEKAYLKGFTREPDKETLHMEYWQRLVNLNANTLALQAATAVCQTSSHHDTVSYDSQTRNTCKAESARRHTLEDYDKNMRLYQLALDRLEGLIVARIFELTKMNRAGTGYKLCKHIAKALQTRSVAIRSALSTYNAVASVMSPPHKMLKWEEVIDYAFLADFDLLHDTRTDISQSLWSSPAARSEISQLNIKVCRLVTYIRDEDNYLRMSEEQLKNTNPGLAHQISIFNSHHLKRLQDISQLSGFSGTLAPGVNTLEDLEEEEEEEEEEIAEEASRRLQDVLFIAEDLSRLELSDHTDLE